jgi:hypothetical protein
MHISSKELSSLKGNIINQVLQELKANCYVFLGILDSQGSPPGGADIRHSRLHVGPEVQVVAPQRRPGFLAARDTG